MTFGLVITAITSQIVVYSSLLDLLVNRSDGEMSPTFLWWALSFVELCLVVWISRKSRNRGLAVTTGLLAFGVYAGFNGLTIGPVLSLYTGVSALKVFLISAGMFLFSCIWGHLTRRNLNSIGEFMIMGLFGLLIAMIVNIFLHSPMMDFLICVVGIVVFVGLTAYDMQQLRVVYDREGPTFSASLAGALDLYLDFVNLFVFLLHLFGVMSSDD